MLLPERTTRAPTGSVNPLGAGTRWFPDQFLEGDGDSTLGVGFTPQVKPAEEVIRRWYDGDGATKR